MSEIEFQKDFPDKNEVYRLCFYFLKRRWRVGQESPEKSIKLRIDRLEAMHLGGREEKRRFDSQNGDVTPTKNLLSRTTRIVIGKSWTDCWFQQWHQQSTTIDVQHRQTYNVEIIHLIYS